MCCLSISLPHINTYQFGLDAQYSTDIFTSNCTLLLRTFDNLFGNLNGNQDSSDLAAKLILFR